MNPAEEHEPATSRPLTISHAEMNAAIDHGDAAPLSQSHGWLARYLDAWWIEYEGGWLRLIDEASGRDLDQVAARLAEVSPIAQGDMPGIRTEGGSSAPEAATDDEAGTPWGEARP
jgi:hypothetical protein